MTMIDVDTSPLQAAREWRGIGIVAAAMSSGLTLVQAEALESGDPDGFDSIDEMIAAAVVYGASIGIGRDEATALLDRTVCRTGAQVELPDPVAQDARPGVEFSEAVHSRSAAIAGRDAISTPPMEVAELESETDGQDEPVQHGDAHEPVDVIEPIETSAYGPTPEQAVAASGEIHLDDAFGPEAPWDRDDSGTGELAAWMDDLEEVDAAPVLREPRSGSSLGARIGGTAHTALERIVGTDRADAAADWTSRTSERIASAARSGRERLRRSEHATLFVAIGGGALLIALVVAIGGALGGSDEGAEPGPADRNAATTEAAQPADGAAATAGETAADEGAAKAPAKKAAMLAPAKITVDVFNAGSKAGYAKEVAAKLEKSGYRIGEVTNAKDYDAATIIHPAGRAREARVLARRTGVTSVKEAPGSTSRFTLVVT